MNDNNMTIDIIMGITTQMKLLSDTLYNNVTVNTSIDKALSEINTFYDNITTLRNKHALYDTQIATQDVAGHTKYLQGLDLPIMVNSIISDDKTELLPSTVCEMHIGNVNGKSTLLITPDIIG